MCIILKREVRILTSPPTTAVRFRALSYYSMTSRAQVVLQKKKKRRDEISLSSRAALYKTRGALRYLFNQVLRNPKGGQRKADCLLQQ